MRLLAIETTEKQGSITFSEFGELLRNFPLSGPQRSAQTLIPAIRSGLLDLGWRPDDLTHVAVAIGPGSFTGLRVGLTTARILAYAANASIIGVNTLQAIAATLPATGPAMESAAILGVAMDAQRGDLSVQFFEQIPNGIPRPISEIELLSVNAWWNKTATFAKIIVSGPILPKILDRKPENVMVAEKDSWNPTAAGVAIVAWDKINRKQIDDIWTLQPFYSRLSAAEEKRQILRYCAGEKK